jgi:hypothetical protein
LNGTSSRDSAQGFPWVNFPKRMGPGAARYGEDCLPIATVAFAPLAPLQHLQPGEPGVFP